MDTVTAAPGFADALVHLSGFVFVLLVLAVLWLVVEAIGVWFRSQDKKNAELESLRKQVAASEQAAVAPPTTVGDGLPEGHLVAIASAVAMLLGSQSRIVTIHTANADWCREGRRELMHSHSYRSFK